MQKGMQVYGRGLRQKKVSSRTSDTQTEIRTWDAQNRKYNVH